jgi:ElaB/YqjD/DUF883 family membrane-anchored ribosome-binding protein
MKNHKSAAQTPKELLEELRTLVAEAETMIRDAAEDSGGLFDSLRSRFASIQEGFGGAYAGARKKVTAGAKYTDEAIRSSPYQSLAIAAVIGLVFGMLASRNNK